MILWEFLKVKFGKTPFKITGLARASFSNRFAIDNIIMLVATGLVNLFNYGYQLAMGILLSAAEYGTLLSLISILVIVGVLTQTVTTTVTRTTATLVADSRPDLIGSFYRVSLKYSIFSGIILFVILAVLSPLISRFLNLNNVVYVFILFSSFLFAFPLASIWGILQGLQKFISLGSSQVLLAICKITIAVLFITLGFGVAGGVAALPLSFLLSLIFTLVSLKRTGPADREKIQILGMGKYSVFVLLTYAAIVILTNVDVVIAKHFLSPAEAGNYSAVSVLGRIAFYAPAGIAVVLFPKAAQSARKGENGKRHFLLAVGLTLLIVLLVSLIYGLFPGVVTQFLFADKFQNTELYLFKYGVAMSLLAIAYLVVHYALSIGKTGIAYLMLTVMVIHLVLLSIFHQSIAQFVIVMLISGGLAVVLSSIWLFVVTTLRK